MASGGERPDLEALAELEEVLRHFEHELAGWRRRALSAETRLAESGGDPGGASSSRLQQLEDENSMLSQRLLAAKGHLGDLLERLRFLEQQQGNGGAER
jgi:hypothetical protein